MRGRRAADVLQILEHALDGVLNHLVGIAGGSAGLRGLQCSRDGGLNLAEECTGATAFAATAMVMAAGESLQ